jgi:hypothetical protein
MRRKLNHLFNIQKASVHTRDSLTLLYKDFFKYKQAKRVLPDTGRLLEIRKIQSSIMTQLLQLGYMEVYNKGSPHPSLFYMYHLITVF